MIGGGNSRKQPKTCVWGFGCRGKRNFAKVSVCRFRINLPNPLPFPCVRKVEKSNNKTLSPYGLFKRGRLKTRHIFSPSNNLIGKCELAEHPVYVYDNEHRAGVAQSVEQRIRNAKVGGSIPFSGTRLDKERSSENLVLGFQTTFLYCGVCSRLRTRKVSFKIVRTPSILYG